MPEAAYRRPDLSDINASTLVDLPAMSSIRAFPIDDSASAVSRASAADRRGGTLRS